MVTAASLVAIGGVVVERRPYSNLQRLDGSRPGMVRLYGDHGVATDPGDNTEQLERSEHSVVMDELGSEVFHLARG